jgi:phospholipase A2
MLDVLDCLKGLSCELAELDLGSSVDVIHAPVSPLEFHRKYVAANKPCIIRGAIEHWDALTRWTPEYLKTAVGHVEVTVDFTPNGKGDAVTTLGAQLRPAKGT